MRIVVANEPAAHRDVFAAVLHMLRPEAEVAIVDPTELDEAIGRLNPDLVLCSRLSEAIERLVPHWVVLYPDGAAQVEIGSEGRRTTKSDLELDEILSIADHAAALAQAY